MSHETLISVLDDLDAIYESRRQDNERYANSSKAQQVFIDKRHDELCHYHECLKELEPLRRFPLWLFDVAGQVDALSCADPELDGIRLLIKFHPDGNNYGQIIYKLYADPAH